MNHPVFRKILTVPRSTLRNKSVIQEGAQFTVTNQTLTKNTRQRAAPLIRRQLNCIYAESLCTMVF